MALIENTYVGDGSTVLYSFTFPYISEADVRVSLDGVDTTEYFYANATTIQMNAAPANGVVVRIYRRTSNDDLKAVFFAGSAIRAQDLNDNFTQNLYVTQESEANATDAIVAAQAAAASSAAASSAAQAAATDASAAQADAAAALSSASSAVSTANSAVTTANSASSTATQAETTANAALTAVSAALAYEIIANVSAIPSNPANNKAVEITDSTGIEGFTPLSGLPGGFVGDAALYVRIVYSSGASSWIYQSYGPNDPESRYLSTADVVNSVSSTSTGSPAAAAAVKTAYDLASAAQTSASQGVSDAATALSTANAAQTTADAALPKAGGTMTGTITFANGQTIQGYALLTATQTFTAAQRGAVGALTSGATVAVNLATSNNFSLTLTTNATLDAPTNVVAGQSGAIVITQDGSGSRTLAYNTVYKFPGGTVPTLSTAGGSVDVLAYYVESPTRITCRLVKDVK